MHSDLRLAFRKLGQSPGFTIVAVVTLALGIGATTAIFSLIHSALLRPLPYPEPERLVEMWTRLPSGEHYGLVHTAKFKQIRDHATSFSEIAASCRTAFNLIEGGAAERVMGLEVSTSYLPMLGCTPALGLPFAKLSDQVGGENHVVLLTDAWWQTRFGGDPEIVGRTINLNDSSYTVIGVLPPRALFEDDVHFLTPLLLDTPAWRQDPESDWLGTLLRLRPGVTVAQAEQEVDSLAREVDRRLIPTISDRRRTEVRPLHTVLTEGERPTMLLLFGAIGLVLLIVCANVANLLLARAQGRHQEMAVRSALGATSAQLFRQVFTEALVLALLGGALGALGAALVVDLLGRAVVGSLPHTLKPVIDPTVLGFSVLLACGTGVIFGLFPALQSRRVDVNQALKQSSRGSSRARTRAQSLLIVAEVALTVMLLIGGGLLLRSFARVLGVDPGFNPGNTLVGDIALTESSFVSNEEVLQFEHALIERLETLPGVVAAGLASTLPLSEEHWGGPISLPDLPLERQPIRGGGIDLVAGNYFPALGIPLRQGRVFNVADNAIGARRVAVINQQLADDLRLPPGETPLGRLIRVRQQNWEIVGIVGNVRHAQLDAAPPRRVYLPNASSPTVVRLVLRTRVEPLSLADDVRRVVAELHPGQSISNLRTLEQAIGRSLQDRRVALVSLGLFALVAVSLACIGIYGVMAYTIGQREREFSIHVALGAQRSDVIGMVLRDGLRLGAAGIILGMLGGIAGSGLVASRLYEVPARDPIVFITVGLVIAVVTSLAVLLPARRATRVDPLQTLRGQ